MAKTKREIDKELLYSKIMPSSTLAEEPFQPAAIPSPNPEPTAPGAAAPRAAAAVSAATAPLREESQGLQLRDKDPTLLVNIMERMVLDKLDTAFAKFNCCKCDRCKKDVVALALNKLKPKYMVIRQSDPSPIPTPQQTAEVTTALVQAIIAVRANPRH